MRRIIAVAGLCSAVMAAWPLMLDTSSARPQGDATFIIPASDGYGVADCLGSGSDCGRVVADGWCEANGFTRAAYFGPALRESITPSSTTPTRAEAALTIACED